MKIPPGKIRADQAQPTGDTLILKATKHAGYGLFEGGHWTRTLYDIPEEDERRSIIPGDLSDLKQGRQEVDIKVPQYKRLVEDQHDYLPEFLAINYLAKIDTANLPSPVQNSVEVILGKQDGAPVYIVDENGNQDYREDFCSRVCFLIDPNGQVLDRFEIADWRQTLAEHFR